MFNSKEKLSELGKTLWSLNETIGELRASCELIAKAVEKQEERIRAVENELVSLKADIRVASAETRESAGDKATSVASTLIAAANGEIFTRISELQNQLDAMVDITYSGDLKNTKIVKNQPKKTIPAASE